MYLDADKSFSSRVKDTPLRLCLVGFVEIDSCAETLGQLVPVKLRYR